MKVHLVLTSHFEFVQKEANEYIENIRKTFGAFNYTPRHTPIDPSRLDQYIDEMIAKRTDSTEESPSFEKLEQPYQDKGNFYIQQKRDDDQNLESDDSNSVCSDVKSAASNRDQFEEKYESSHDSDEPDEKN